MKFSLLFETKFNRDDLWTKMTELLIVDLRFSFIFF